MARIAVDAEAVKASGNPITVKEPACGSGGVVLALAELFAPDSVDLLRVTAQDVNPVAVDMSYINLTLWGIPSRLILGDTLRGTVTRQWCNIHWLRVGEHDRQKIDAVRKFLPNVNVAEPPSSTIDLGVSRKSNEAKDQFLFDF